MPGISEDEKVKLAEEISKQLTNVGRTEWKTWANYAASKGLEKALEFALTLSRSPTLRPRQKNAYKTIHNTMKNFKNKIEKLPEKNQQQVLGYVERWIIARRAHPL
ncbi:MAG: hypothetical protein ACTSWP_05550 [Candidatus Freyarchaeota archaeon]|mgnify:CR=1 FL=1